MVHFLSILTACLIIFHPGLSARVKRGGKGCSTAKECMSLYAVVEGTFVNAKDGNGKTCETRTRVASAFGSEDKLMTAAKSMIKTSYGDYYYDGCVREAMGGNRRGKRYYYGDYYRPPPPPWQNGGQQNGYPPPWNNSNNNRNNNGQQMNNQRQQNRDSTATTCQCTTDTGNCDSDSKKTSVLSIVHTDTTSYPGNRLIVTNGIPDHCYQTSEIAANPNPACERFSFMLIPDKVSTTADRSSRSFTATNMGPIGIAVSGGYLYNHKSAETSCNVAAIQEKDTFDPCDGHADQKCRYHYHKAPVCIPGYNKCKLMGYVLDGGPVYGECTLEGGLQLKSCYRLKSGKDGCKADEDYEYVEGDGCHLDKANGYYFEKETKSAYGDVFPAGSYAYFVTKSYPFLMPYYAGRPTRLCSIPVTGKSSTC